MNETGCDGRSAGEHAWSAVDVPVLLIVFNRPDKVRRMVANLGAVRPRRLFVAADGPRAAVKDDAERCVETRRVLDSIDWPCVVEKLYQDTNLGCKLGPETAIGWFFSKVTAGVILEDDCLPTADFFPFCAELLDRYQDSDDVMMISGFNKLGSWDAAKTSYVVSRTSPTWGWATWARAWQAYDPAMLAWGTREGKRTVRRRLPFVEYLMARKRFDRVYGEAVDAWDFAWAFAMLRSGGVSLISAQNTVINVGFDEDATHTRNPWSPDSRVPTAPIPFPLVHLDRLEPSTDFEKAMFRSRFPLRRRIMTLLPTEVADRIRSIVYGVAARRLLPGLDTSVSRRS